MNDFLEAFDGYVALVALFILLVAFWKPIYRRIEGGSEVDVGIFKIGAMTKDTEDAREQAQRQGGRVEVFGDPDQLKLMFKAQAEGWKKSTKGLEVPGGCLIQVTSERLNADGSWATAEALEFVPGVALVPTSPGGYGLGRLHQR